MPSTIAEVDAAYQFDWGRWPVPQMPDVLVEPWAGVPGSFWVDDISARPVDAVRTRALVDFDVPIGTEAGDVPWQGSTYGVPYQLIDSAAPTTPVWDQAKPITWNWFTPTFPIVNVPLPKVVRRDGDPVGSFDLHWMGYDQTRRVLWEGIGLRKSPLNRWQTWGRCDWVAGYNGGGPAFSRWDTSRPWDATGQPRGVVAGKTPKFPMIARFDEVVRAIASGDADASLGHAMFGVLPNYAPGFIAPARGSDGGLSGHPLKAGARLRLPWFQARTHKAGTPARVIANTLARHGFLVLDKCMPANTPAKIGRGVLSLSMDSRWALGAGPIVPLGDMKLRLASFEVLS